jgi:cobalt-zinc-cadmium efflux system outer membrane protein
MRCVLSCAALTVALLPSMASAQSMSLSEADVLARLSAESPRVRAIRAAIDIARADVLSASRWPNPRFIEDRESVAGVTEYLTMVAQPLPITGRRGLEVQSAAALVDAASARSDDALRRARADLRLAYAQLVAAQTRERTLAASRDRLRELTDILAKREAVGDAAGFDRLRAEREVSDLEADLGVAATERARAQAALVAFFAEPADPSRVVATGARRGTSAAVPNIEALVESAITARGDLRALQKDADAAEFAARAADRRRIPEPEVIAGTKSSTFEGGGIGSVFTVSVPLPLFDRGKPERALAEARASQAHAQADLFRVTLRADLEALRATLVERRRTAERYLSSAVAGADEIERVARVSYDAGERGILELLDAYRAGSSARARQATLDLAVRQAEVELEFLSGWEMP